MENLITNNTKQQIISDIYNRREKMRERAEYVARLKMRLYLVTILLVSVIGSMYVYTNRQKFVIRVKNNTIFTLDREVNKLEKEKDMFSTKISVAEQKLSESVEMIDGLQDVLVAQTETIEQIDADNTRLKNDNKDLIKDNKSLIKESKNLQDKIKLYEKYDYVVFDKAGKRTDITYEQLKTGEELMKAKGYDPALLFGMIMVESNGKETAANKSSSARGYAQFLNRTGKYVYEDLCKMGSYNHSKALDGDIAIVMMASYLDHLYKLYNGNVTKVIKHYSGRSLNSTYAYMNKINSYISKSGKNVYQMNVSIK